MIDRKSLGRLVLYAVREGFRGAMNERKIEMEAMAARYDGIFRSAESLFRDAEEMLGEPRFAWPENSTGRAVVLPAFLTQRMTDNVFTHGRCTTCCGPVGAGATWSLAVREGPAEEGLVGPTLSVVVQLVCAGCAAKEKSYS